MSKSSFVILLIECMLCFYWLCLVHTSVENVSLSARGNAVSPPFSGSFKYNKTVASLQYNNNINMFYADEGNVFP